MTKELANEHKSLRAYGEQRTTWTVALGRMRNRPYSFTHNRPWRRRESAWRYLFASTGEGDLTLPSLESLEGPVIVIRNLLVTCEKRSRS